VTCAETRPVDLETRWQVGIGKEQEWIEADENSPAWFCFIHPRRGAKTARGAFRLSRVGSRIFDLLWAWLEKILKNHVIRQSTSPDITSKRFKTNRFVF
jgi:hypothetical protein